MYLRRSIAALVALAALTAHVSAATLTLTIPNTVNQNGQPVSVEKVFIIDPSTGLPSAGGGGGGGGAVTAADGGIASIGAKSDAAYSGTGSGSQIAIAKASNAYLAAIVAGLSDVTPSHVIVDSGAVTISGVSTAANQTAANASLSSIDTKVTGLATATAQTSANGSLATIATNTGTLGAPTDTGNAATDTTSVSLVAAVKGLTSRVNALITALGTPVQTGGSVVIGTGSSLMGNVQVVSGSNVSSVATSSPDDLTATTLSLATRGFGYTYSGTGWDKNKKSSAVCRILSAAASTNATLCSTAKHDVFAIDAYNTSATVKFLKLYNKATSAPTVGTDTPVATIAIPPTSRISITYPGGFAFPLGLGVALTGAVADNDTTALTAGDVIALNIYYQ